MLRLKKRLQCTLVVKFYYLDYSEAVIQIVSNIPVKHGIVRSAIKCLSTEYSHASSVSKHENRRYKFTSTAEMQVIHRTRQSIVILGFASMVMSLNQ